MAKMCEAYMKEEWFTNMADVCYRVLLVIFKAYTLSVNVCCRALLLDYL